jgi:hypothetical protein
MAARREGTETPSSANGLTLGELTEVGREVGLEPADVARAAAALDNRRGVAPLRRELGVPVEVQHEVALPRAPTDEEWERLVSELRATFRARGRVTGTGGLREWSNGHLHAYVEPAASGYRLRLATFKGNARTLTMAGGVGLAAGAVATASAAIGGQGMAAMVAPLMIGAAAAATIAGNLLRLPRWARERTGQMEHVAARAQEIVRAAPASEDEG